MWRLYSNIVRKNSSEILMKFYYRNSLYTNPSTILMWHVYRNLVRTNYSEILMKFHYRNSIDTKSSNICDVSSQQKFSPHKLVKNPDVVSLQKFIQYNFLEHFDVYSTQKFTPHIFVKDVVAYWLHKFIQQKFLTYNWCGLTTVVQSAQTRQKS